MDPTGRQALHLLKQGKLITFLTPVFLAVALFRMTCYLNTEAAILI